MRIVTQIKNDNKVEITKNTGENTEKVYLLGKKLYYNILKR